MDFSIKVIKRYIYIIIKFETIYVDEKKHFYEKVIF